MGLKVDDNLRKKMNNNKEKVDILISINDTDVLIGECKSTKKSYSSFSSVIRQIKSYKDFYEKNNFKVKGCFLVSSDFTENFISDCELFTDFDLSLIDAEALENIYSEFKTKLIYN